MEQIGLSREDMLFALETAVKKTLENSSEEWKDGQYLAAQVGTVSGAIVQIIEANNAQLLKDVKRLIAESK